MTTLQLRTAAVEDFDPTALGNIKGWLAPQAQVITRLLVDVQRRQGLARGILELGVFFGKYLALLSYCMRGIDVPIVGVDAFLERYGKLMSLESRSLHQRAILDAIASVTGKPSKAVLIAGFTKDIALSDLTKLSPKGFSFVSVDAGHEADDLLTDLPIANAVLSEGGIAAMDDVFNSTTPGVAEGFFEYFRRTPEANLAAFATGGNKVFMCRRSWHAFYLQTALSIAQRAEADFPDLAPATARMRDNRNIGWAPQLLGYEIVPL